MVVRRRRNSLGDHPVAMTRFELSEWPGDPVEAFTAWRGEFMAYWRSRRFPGGLFALLGTVAVARRLVRSGEVVELDEAVGRFEDRADRVFGGRSPL